MQERRILGSGSSAPSGAVDKTGAVVGDICISNGTDIWFMPLAEWQAYTGTEYQAIGVTVAAVGDCGDDLVRVCSIPFMDCDTPDVAAMNKAQPICWNGYNAPMYGMTETTSLVTAKADYNGKKNTAAILDYATGQPNWRTDSTITNYSGSSVNYYFPAACCCWRFHTLGTQQGDWYLPAAGELYKGYQNRTAVDSSLQALGMKSAGNRWYWSSTRYDRKYAWRVIWYSDLVSSGECQYSNCVRAFTAF